MKTIKALRNRIVHRKSYRLDLGMQSLTGGGSVQAELHMDKYTYSKQRFQNHDHCKIWKGLKNQKVLIFIC